MSNLIWQIYLDCNSRWLPINWISCTKIESLKDDILQIYYSLPLIEVIFMVIQEIKVTKYSNSWKIFWVLKVEGQWIVYYKI